MPFTWYGFARFTNQLSDLEFCRALYRSGCRMLNLGLESGDQSVLDAMGKGTDLETASRILTGLNFPLNHTVQKSGAVSFNRGKSLYEEVKRGRLSRAEGG